RHRRGGRREGGGVDVDGLVDRRGGDGEVGVDHEADGRARLGLQRRLHIRDAVEVQVRPERLEDRPVVRGLDGVGGGYGGGGRHSGAPQLGATPSPASFI